MPSGVKAWIDQIVRIGVAFNHSLDNGVSQYEPLVLGKKALIVTSRGDFGFGPGGSLESTDHADTLLRTVLESIGISDVTVVAAEGRRRLGLTARAEVAGVS